MQFPKNVNTEKSESFCSYLHAERSKTFMGVPCSVCEISKFNQQPNCLPTLRKMAQLSANIAQMFAIIAIHCPSVFQHAKDQLTVCQPLVTKIIKLNPSSFLFWVLVFPSIIVWFLCFAFSQVSSFVYISE